VAQVNDLIAFSAEISNRGAFYEVMNPEGHFIWVATHTYQQPDGSWLPKTRAGVFVCQRGTHIIPTGESFDTFEVMGVPGHTGILFPHPGNLPERDSDGCFISGLGLGYLNNQRDVIASRDAFAKFSKYMAGVDQFQLTIKEMA
jgi:hypothetical protein